MDTCPFCHLRHDPEKTHCNDPHTGALIRRAGPLMPTLPNLDAPRPIKLDLTPFGALSLLVNRVNEIKGQWTESLDTAMQQAEEVIQCEQDRLSQLATDLNSRRSTEGPAHITIEPRDRVDTLNELGDDWVLVPKVPTQEMLDAAFYPAHDEKADQVWQAMIEARPEVPQSKPQEAAFYGPGIPDLIAKHKDSIKELMQSIHPDNPPLTCVQLLEHARDSMDAADAELQAANKVASGIASMLLLDMIHETHVMACRIRAILAAASNEAGYHIYCLGDGSWLREIRGAPMGDVFTMERDKALPLNKRDAEAYENGPYRMVKVGEKP